MKLILRSKLLYHLFLVILLSLSCITAIAQNPFAIRFDVIDEYTREEMDRDSLLVDVMRPDSTMIFEALPFNKFVDKWFERQDMLLRLYQHGFISQYVKIPKPGNRIDYLNLESVIMPRDMRISHRTKMLDEVTVTASVVKMVHKGDTLIYNADAFQLGSGSMLDQLVRALPGVELRGGGQIYVNGRYVESLLLNGKDFFKGNPTVALSNLPSYMVSKIKVYEKETALSRLNDEKAKPMAMDVTLKKEYMHGWIANAEAGYGTDNRYVGRLFGLNFSSLSRLALFGNINNTNDATTPGEDETWNSNWQEAGIETTHKAGVDYMLSAANNSWEFNPIFTATRSRISKSEDGNETLFLPSGTMSRVYDSSNQNRSYDFLLTPNFRYDERKIYINIEPSLRYNRNYNDYRFSSAMSNDGIQLNSESRRYSAWSHRWDGRLDLSSMFAIPSTPDHLSFNIKADFQDNSGATDGGYMIDYTKEPSADGNNTKYRQVTPQKSWQISGSTDYHARIPGRKNSITKIKVYYQYCHTYRRDIRTYYDSTPDSELLPSDSEGQRLTFSIDDSYKSQVITNSHAIGGFIVQQFNNWGFRISPDCVLGNRRIDYHRFGRDYNISRTNFLPGGEVNFYVSKYFDVTYKFRLTTPSLLDLLDITDSTNPLYIRRGNSNLNNTRNHSIELTPRWLEGALHSDTWATIRLRYNRTDCAIARSVTYDTNTGVTTYRPENINGNWNINALISCGYYLDKKRKLILSTKTNIDYINSADLVDTRRSIVRTLSIDERLKLDWKLMDGLNIAAIGNGNWRHSTSPEVSFSRINAVDFDLGLTVNATRLPWDMSLTTDLTMHFRRGYSDPNLNDNHLVWNARLAKSIFHGNLTFAIDGYDILGQLSNVVYEVNAQGRTETRYNTLPRYAMLHVIYRLNIQPKKR